MNQYEPVSTLPTALQNLIAQFGFTAADYDRALARHEAAHVVFAVLHDADLKYIDLTAEYTNGFSRARAEWSPGREA